MSNITYAHPRCFYCQGWAREAETEANRHPNAKAAQVGDYHHWARYHKDPTQAPAESEIEMTEHLHYIEHTHQAGYGILTKFTCKGDRTSPCHQYLSGHDQCWMKYWMEDADCAEICCPDGEPVRSGPITVTFNGDCVEWKYAEEVTV